MEHFLDVDDRFIEYLHNDLFPAIHAGQVVLFLGAGASVTEKKYLGAHIITYYQDKLGINAETNDLVEFVDIISSRPDFNRADFDNFVEHYLFKLKPTETHKRIAAINWVQIISTNLDLLLERAQDQLMGTPEIGKLF